jgi:hypothetical protein
MRKRTFEIIIIDIVLSNRLIHVASEGYAYYYIHINCTISAALKLSEISISESFKNEVMGIGQQ